MSLEKVLQQRSGNVCELCQAAGQLSIYAVPPDSGSSADENMLVCETCRAQLEQRLELDPTHWSFLTSSMWSEVPAVQVVSWRMLNRLRDNTWAADALEMMYLSDEHLEWAKATGDHGDAYQPLFHRDSNGAILQAGDTVVLIKSLDVKGSTIQAKVGTSVRNIRLVTDNIEQIEGKIDGQQVVVLTKFVRKG